MTRVRRSYIPAAHIPANFPRFLASLRLCVSPKN